MRVNLKKRMWEAPKAATGSIQQAGDRERKIENWTGPFDSVGTVQPRPPRRLVADPVAAFGASHIPGPRHLALMLA